MSEEPQTTLVYISAQEAAERANVQRTRIKQWDREGLLVAVKRDGVLVVPESLLEPDPEAPGSWRPRWNARGTILVLRDAGYDSEEIVSWLYRTNDELGDAPISALIQGRHKQVNRIAQTLGF